MRRLRGSALRALWADESAPTAAEYAIMASLIAVVVVASVTAFGVGTRSLFERLSTAWP